MARQKGSKNKVIPEDIVSEQERIVRLANIIVEYIVEDQTTGKLILRELSISELGNEPRIKR